MAKIASVSTIGTCDLFGDRPSVAGAILMVRTQPGLLFHVALVAALAVSIPADGRTTWPGCSRDKQASAWRALGLRAFGLIPMRNRNGEPFSVACSLSRRGGAIPLRNVAFAAIFRIASASKGMEQGPGVQHAAVSITNTNWQSIPVIDARYTAQMAGLRRCRTLASAEVGIASPSATRARIRLDRKRPTMLGNSVDLVRICSEDSASDFR